MKNKTLKNSLVLGTIFIILLGMNTITKDRKLELINNNLAKERFAIYIKNEANNYEKSSSIPTNGYILNESKSACNNDAKPRWNLETNSLILSDLTKSNTSCYLYFDEYCAGKDEACKKILENKIVSARNKIVGPITQNTTGKIYAAEDDNGISYYFAGSVDNNWIMFANNYWRIIRVNGDGSIRLIYNGPTLDQIGETTQIGTSAFNEQYADNAYVGYMYGAISSSTYKETHANINDSTIKTVLDNWYQDNIANNELYLSKIDNNATFCNDRQIYNSNSAEYTNEGYSTAATSYRALSAVYNQDWLAIQKPTLRCKSVNDKFSKNNGNKSLKNNISLITMDEAIFAGLFGGDLNDDNYLNTKQNYWTLTPNDMYTHGHARIFKIRYDGYLSADDVETNNGIRPVINLKANVKLEGDGTKSNPYIVID